MMLFWREACGIYGFEPGVKEREVYLYVVGENFNCMPFIYHLYDRVLLPETPYPGQVYQNLSDDYRRGVLKFII